MTPARCSLSERARPIRALLVTPQRLVADGLVALAASRQDICIAGVAGTVAEALAGITACGAEVLLIDAALGSALVCALLAETRHTAAAPLVINAPENPAAIVDYIERGARGYTTACEPFSAVVDALLAVEREEAACSPEVMASVFRRLFQRSRSAVAPDRPAASLTRREAQVVVLVARGLSDKQVAHQLGIGVSTVKKHVHHVLAKLHVHRRRDAVRFAARSGLLRQHATSGDRRAWIGGDAT